MEHGGTGVFGSSPVPPCSVPVVPSWGIGGRRGRDSRGLWGVWWANRSRWGWLWGRTSVSSGVLRCVAVLGVGRRPVVVGGQGDDRYPGHLPGGQKPGMLTQPETRLLVHRTGPATPAEQRARTAAGLTASVLVHRVQEQQGVEGAAGPAAQGADSFRCPQPRASALHQGLAQPRPHLLLVEVNSPSSETAEAALKPVIVNHSGHLPGFADRVGPSVRDGRWVPDESLCADNAGRAPGWPGGGCGQGELSASDIPDTLSCRRRLVQGDSGPLVVGGDASWGRYRGS
jgi:hypothetical protein